jgi:hypothetical protein
MFTDRLSVETSGRTQMRQLPIAGALCLLSTACPSTFGKVPGGSLHPVASAPVWVAEVKALEGPKDEAVSGQLRRLAADCEPPSALRVRVEAKYFGGKLIEVQPSFYDGGDFRIPRAVKICLESRARETPAVNSSSAGTYELVVQYVGMGHRFPYPVPIASGPSQDMGACTPERWSSLKKQLAKGGYDVRRFAFVDGTAIATKPEQLDRTGVALRGEQRFLALGAGCWERYGWSGMLERCWADAPAELVRSYAFVCSSAPNVVQFDYDAADPAFAYQKIVMSGQLEEMPADSERARGQLFGLVYVYERRSGSGTFTLQTQRDVVEDLRAVLLAH